MNGTALASCRRIIDDLMNDPDAWPFNQPVDPIALGIPDYLIIIKHPMDFSTVKVSGAPSQPHNLILPCQQKKLESGQYQDMKAFAADVQLVFTNAITYNESESDIAAWARKLRKLFDNLWAGLQKEVTPPSSPTQAIPKRPPAQPDLVSTLYVYAPFTSELSDPLGLKNPWIPPDKVDINLVK
jgi:hypothetical protein